ncbi:hypothetical protein [Nocardia flavorosea]|uniref:DUF8020 domain-containing protein n=1 Tax=Nocardia flavorosea TaxID=53429 RepID=A0A846YMQ8_9NOCA|nr:hypothetical protein [Nocardia flavorosea]NKY58890.1 hypothetical protein [Nocardia flavorosea]
MRIKYIAATALLSIGALGAAAGTAHADPRAAAEVAVRGTEQGVGYVAAPNEAGTAVVTTLDTGSFRLAAGGAAVLLADAAGHTLTTLPLGVTAAGTTAPLAAAVSADGRTLTLTPEAATPARDHLAQLVADPGTEARKMHNAGIGALIGGGIGAVLGFFLGGVGALITIPIGAGIGALIGYSTP